MAQNLSDNIRTLAPKPLDDKWGVFDPANGGWRPFNNIAEFNSLFVLAARFENMTFWVRSATVSTKSDLYSLDKNKTPFKVLNDVLFKIIAFEDAEGIITINFTSDMVSDFTRPQTTVWGTNDINENEVGITGYIPTINKTGGVIQSITLDGVFGTGYILLTN